MRMKTRKTCGANSESAICGDLFPEGRRRLKKKPGSYPVREEMEGLEESWGQLSMNHPPGGPSMKKEKENEHFC